jgi:hypothetical protein
MLSFKIFCPCFGELRFRKNFSETKYKLVITPYVNIAPCALSSLRASLINPVLILVRNCIIFI